MGKDTAQLRMVGLRAGLRRVATVLLAFVASIGTVEAVGLSNASAATQTVNVAKPTIAINPSFARNVGGAAAVDVSAGITDAVGKNAAYSFTYHVNLYNAVTNTLLATEGATDTAHSGAVVVTFCSTAYAYSGYTGCTRPIPGLQVTDTFYATYTVEEAHGSYAATSIKSDIYAFPSPVINQSANPVNPTLVFGSNYAGDPAPILRARWFGDTRFKTATYTVNLYDAANDSLVARTTTMSSSGVDFSGIPWGHRYYVAVSVVATSATGVTFTAPPSNSTVLVDPAPPSAPTNVTATIAPESVWAPYGGVATVRWTPPASDGASPPVTSYKVTATPSTKPAYCWTSAGTIDTGCSQTSALSCTTTTATTCTMSGLRLGFTYTFTVTATNAIGVTSSVADGASTATVVGPPSWQFATGIQALTSPSPIPGGPTVVNGDRSVSISWSANSFTDDGSPVTSYTAYVLAAHAEPSIGQVSSYANLFSNYSYGDSFAPWVVVGSCTTTSLSCDVSGLLNDASYQVVVRASNAAGQGPMWASSAAYPDVRPDAPTNVQATVNGNQVTFTWTPPANAAIANILYYRVALDGLQVNQSVVCQSASDPWGWPSWSPYWGGLPTASCTATIGSPPTFEGSSYYGKQLNLATRYTTLRVVACGVQVIIHTQDVSCTASDPVPGFWTSPPPPPPLAPLTAATSPGDSTLKVSWVPPAVSGNTKYVAVAYPPGTSPASPGVNWVGYCVYTISSPETDTCTISGLTNGVTYPVFVWGFNATGASYNPVSAPTGFAQTSGTPSGVLGPPTQVAATPSVDGLTITWAPPLSDGGSAVLSYGVDVYDASNNLVGSCSYTVRSPETDSCSIASLTGGPYTVTVHATNGTGDGPQSPATSPVTPLRPTPPTAPNNVSAQGGVNTATISWVPPTSTGGAAITSYTAKLLRHDVVVGTCTYTVSSPETDTCTATNVPAGPYDVEVIAHNRAGDSSTGTTTVLVTDPPPPPPAPSGPGVPSDVIAVPGDNTAAVTWSPSTDDGGSPILRYVVIVTDPDGNDVGTCTYVLGLVDPETYSCTVDGLDNGVVYTYSVYAENSIGASDAAFGINTVTPIGPADAPYKPVGVVSGARSIDVSWLPPANAAITGITSYTITAYDGSGTDVGSCTYTVSNPETDTCTVNNLDPGTYTFTAYGTNSSGQGDISLTSDPVALVNPPTAPTEVSAVGGINEATISWIPSLSDGGSTITSYTASLLQGGVVIASCTYTVSSPETDTCTAIEVPGGTYDVEVIAHNAQGDSSAGTTTVDVNDAPDPQPPSVPTDLSATPGDGSVTITWGPSADDGGSDIVNYVVTVLDPSGTVVGTCSVDASPELESDSYSCTVDGLTDGIDYTYEAHAENSVGISDEAQATAPVTPVGPLGPPDPPTDVTIVAPLGNGTVTWLPPTYVGGSPVTSYTVMITDPSGRVVGTCSVDASLELALDSYSCTVDGLPSNVVLTATVIATNIAGTSSPSSGASVLSGGFSCPLPTSMLIIDGTLLSSVDLNQWSPQGNSNITMNAVGFGADGVLYGIGSSSGKSNHLIRMVADGARTDLGVISGLPARVHFVAGDINQSLGQAGTLYVASGNSASVYAIDVSTRTATMLSLPRGFKIGQDLAVIGSAGNYWIFTSHGGKIAGFNINTLATVAYKTTGTSSRDNLFSGADGNSLSWINATGAIYTATGLLSGRFSSSKVGSAPGASGNNIDGALCYTPPAS